MSRVEVTTQPLTLFVGVEVHRDPDDRQWTAVVDNYSETTFVSEFKQEAIDGALALAQRLFYLKLANPKKAE